MPSLPPLYCDDIPGHAVPHVPPTASSHVQEGVKAAAEQAGEALKSAAPGRGRRMSGPADPIKPWQTPSTATEGIRRWAAEHDKPADILPSKVLEGRTGPRSS